MKISPVVGTPTIPTLSSTGLSPDKLAVIKAIASGQPKPEPEKIEDDRETIALGQAPLSSTQRIKMNVNRSTTRPIDPQLESTPIEENAPPVDSKPEGDSSTPVVDSDTSVQAKPKLVANGAVSPELAELAKQKRALQIEREQFAKEKASQGQVPEGYIKADDLKTNALSVLQKHGVTYEQLTNEILGQQNQQPDLKSFKDELLKEIDSRLAGKDSQQEEAVYTFMRSEVDKLSALPKYRLIKESGSQDDVMDYVKRMWKEKGEIVTEWEAMDAIEFELREDAKRYAKLMGELEPTKAPAETPQVQATGQRTKTLTNKDSARPVMNRRQRAIAAALGQK